MIPYYQLDAIIIGPITIHVWGLMVALGIIAGLLYSTRLAKKHLMSEDVILDAAIWSLISALVFARLFHVFFYAPNFYFSNPLNILKIWEGGLSSLGGFFGAFIALFVFAYLRKFTLRELLPYADIASVGLWLGWGIGRIGCFLIHDHPGMLSNSFLAVNFPSGARFDLGLFDSLLGFALFAVFAPLFNRLTKIKSGLVAAYSWLSYAVVRFFFDFLRATDLPGSDVRYLHLTPAQWGMVIIATTLTFWLIYSKISPPGKKTSENEN